MPIRVMVDEVFANCPKDIQRRTLVVDDALDSRPAIASLTDALTSAQRERITCADSFFIASGHAERGLEASHRGGAPGFVEVLDKQQIAWPDYKGNAMFQTLGNLESDPRAGVVFADFTIGNVLQLTGRARGDWDPARAARFAGAERVVEFSIDEVREARGALPPRAHGRAVAAQPMTRVAPRRTSPAGGSRRPIPLGRLPANSFTACFVSLGPVPATASP